MRTNNDPSRTALITGASAGLGAEFAHQLAAAGLNLILVARRASALATLAAELEALYAVNVHCLAFDLSEPSSPEQLFAAVQHQQLRVDYLINNAGAGGPDFLNEGDWLAQSAYLQLMVSSVVGLSYLFLPGMRQRQFGRIVNVASVAARIPRAGDCNYGAAKAYLIAFSEGLALTLQHENVHCLALCPGFTHTDFHLTPKLADMKAQTPDWLWYDAKLVVAEALAALRRGRRVYSSGRLYRWLDPLLQLPGLRQLIIRVVNHSSRSASRPPSG